LQREQRKNTRHDTLWRPTPFNLASSWHGSLDGHHMPRPILAGFRGSNGTGHCERWITGFTRLYHDMSAFRTTLTTYASPCVCRKRTYKDIDYHVNSPSIVRSVVADDTPWRAASPTRLRVISTGAALASALQPYALILRHRLERGSSEGSTRARHASKRARYGRLGCS